MGRAEDACVAHVGHFLPVVKIWDLCTPASQIILDIVGEIYCLWKNSCNISHRFKWGLCNLFILLLLQPEATVFLLFSLYHFCAFSVLCIYFFILKICHIKGQFTQQCCRYCLNCRCKQHSLYDRSQWSDLVDKLNVWPFLTRKRKDGKVRKSIVPWTAGSDFIVFRKSPALRLHNHGSCRIFLEFCILEPVFERLHHPSHT